MKGPHLPLIYNIHLEVSLYIIGAIATLYLLLVSFCYFSFSAMGEGHHIPLFYLLQEIAPCQLQGNHTSNEWILVLGKQHPLMQCCGKNLFCKSFHSKTPWCAATGSENISYFWDRAMSSPKFWIFCLQQEEHYSHLKFTYFDNENF